MADPKPVEAPMDVNVPEGQDIDFTEELADFQVEEEGTEAAKEDVAEGMDVSITESKDGEAKVDKDKEDKDSDSDDTDAEDPDVDLLEHQKSHPEFYDNSLLQHPHWELLKNFEPSEDQLTKPAKITMPPTLLQTPFVFVNDKDLLATMVEALKKVTEMAVWEKTSQKEFEEKLVLLGIGIEGGDYLIDVLAFTVEDLQVLQPFFADPKVVKVFMKHSHHRFYFLQQKFKLYFVNIFDVIPATKYVLQDLFRAGGFYSRLRTDFGVVVNHSKLRAVEFCRRPLNIFQIEYCRYSFHYLLYFYNKIKTKFITTNIEEYKTFIKNCNKKCMVYIEDPEDSGYKHIEAILDKHHERQLYIADKLLEWRDTVAKAANKNPNEILENTRLEYLALEHTRDNATTIRIAQSKYVKDHIEEIAAIMMEAKSKFGKSTMRLSKRYRKINRWTKSQIPVGSPKPIANPQFRRGGGAVGGARGGGRGGYRGFGGPFGNRTAHFGPKKW